MGTTEIFRVASDRSRAAFTLIELIIVILIIAILATIAVPQFKTSMTDADRVRAESNHRTGCKAMEHTWLNIVLRGGYRYVDPDTGKPVDATYMSDKEKRIQWYDWKYNESNWPEFSSVSDDVINCIILLTGTDFDTNNMNREQLVLASFARDQTVYYTIYYRGEPIESNTFYFDDGPPNGPVEEGADSG
ncbi:prepilin-type N-terminal cleavage/methylation domain-containing protein [Thermodesulfobacteriota bacterium]